MHALRGAGARGDWALAAAAVTGHWQRLHALRGAGARSDWALAAAAATAHSRRLHALRGAGAPGVTEHPLPLRALRRRRSAEGKPQAGTQRA